MAHEEQQPMSEARLAEIRERLLTDGVSRWLVRRESLSPLSRWLVRRESLSLLAEVERLRAREAALVEVVRAVADADVICNHYFDILDGYPHAPEHVDYLCPTVGHPKASTVRAQARVLLATESKRGDGDGA